MQNEDVEAVLVCILWHLKSLISTTKNLLLAESLWIYIQNNVKLHQNNEDKYLRFLRFWCAVLIISSEADE